MTIAQCHLQLGPVLQDVSSVFVLSNIFLWLWIELVTVQVDALYGAEKDGVWYRVRVERCPSSLLPLCCFALTIIKTISQSRITNARLWQGRSASNALVRMVDFGWGCTLPIKRWLIYTLCKLDVALNIPQPKFDDSSPRPCHDDHPLPSLPAGWLATQVIA